MATVRTPIDFLLAPSLGELIAAELSEWGDVVEKQAAEDGQSRIVEARVRILRRASHQIRAASTEVS